MPAPVTAGAPETPVDGLVLQETEQHATIDYMPHFMFDIR
jgi:hypothetical protein